MARAAARIITVEDARRRTQRRVPRVVFDYIDGGAGSESTMRANVAAMGEVTFLPRMGQSRGTPAPELSTTVLGTPVSMPLLLSPVGFTRMMERHGDVAAARAAGAAGTLFTLSSMSGHTMEEVIGAATGPAWFQLYFLGGREGAEQLVDRAQKAGYSALVVTLDTQIPGNREREQRHRVSPPLQMNLRNIVRFAPQVLPHPSWLAGFARDRFWLELANTTGFGTRERPMSSAEALMHWVASPPRWEDFAWMREHWHGPIVAKGIVTADDARRAVDCGVSAIIVSNHGGRQLEGMPVTMPALVEVVEAVGDQVEVLVDGGFRRGADVVRAVALGARAAMIGRPWAYGLAAAGEAGISRVLAILREDIDRTLRLLGCTSIAEVERSHVDIPEHWGRRRNPATTD